MSIAFKMVSNLRMQAVRATLGGFARRPQPLVEGLDHRIAATGRHGGHVQHGADASPTAKDHATASTLAGIAVERADADQGADLAAVQGAQFRQGG